MPGFNLELREDLLNAEHIYRSPYVSHRLRLPARPIQDHIPARAGAADRAQSCIHGRGFRTAGPGPTDQGRYLSNIRWRRSAPGHSADASVGASSPEAGSTLFSPASHDEAARCTARKGTL